MLPGEHALDNLLLNAAEMVEAEGRAEDVENATHATLIPARPD
jgi:hypothetical protein